MNFLFNLLNRFLSGNFIRIKAPLSKLIKADQPSKYEIKSFKAIEFGKEFVWGAATSAFQTEGAHNEDEKGNSIWDSFTNQKGKVKRGEHAKTATEFYRNYQTDIDLLKEMNFNSFRFSLSWSRILPDGIKKRNSKGIDYYHRVIDTCLEKDIQPWITLYHWDLPDALEKKGGWTNRDILNWFGEYAELASKSFGDRVKNWMVLNEPMAFTSLGYLFGIHAPGRKGFKNFLPAVHHAVLCQALGGQILRENIIGSNIGTTFSCSLVDPVDDKPKNIKAALKIDTALNRLFIEPALGMGYPINDLPVLRKISNYIKSSDLEKMQFNFDFIGIQYYYRIIVKHSHIPPFHAREISPEKRGALINEMNFEVYPKGVYSMLKKFSELPNIPRLIITESGVCYRDFLNQDNQINDDDRRYYHLQMLGHALQAKKDGIPVDGYFVWSLTDNFEWVEGYHPRFGLVYIDYSTQKRIIKNSGKWFKNFLDFSRL